MKTVSLLFLILVFALVLCGAVSAGTPLQENQTGTVSGDLYVNTSNPWDSTTLGATNEVTQANTLPAYTSIDSAMVYVNVYSGSGTSNWPVRTTIKLDGNGDGDYDDAGELLGVEDMNIPGSMDGTVYWLNDHCMRVYSDYQVWYNVTGLITSNNPTLFVKTESLGGDGYDGRIKMLALTVAYNDGDNDKVHYWVLNGQDWIDSGPSTSTFNTDSFNGQVSSATLNTVALASTDGTYTLNTNSLTGNLTETGSYYKEHQWDVTNQINAGVDTNLTYTNVGSSLKMNLATLTIREGVVVAPVANFTANPTSGAAPLTVQFTDTSSNFPTEWLWEFGDGNTSPDKNPLHTYNNAGSYTVKLTATNTAGSDFEEKTSYITAYIAPVANFTASKTSGAKPLTVTFTDTSSNTPTEWLWDFGDGTTSPDRNPSHTYTAFGTYTVKLTTTNPAGNDTITRTGYITVPVLSSPVWTAKSTWDMLNIGKYASPCFADLDGDGDYDVLIGTNDGICHAYQNTGTATNPVWTAKSAWNTLDIGEDAAPCLADLDGDGDYDLLIGSYSGTTYAYENTGTASSPVWTAKSAWNTPSVGTSTAPCFADLDGDGDYDLLIGSYSGICYGYENTGTASSPVWTAKSAWNTLDIGEDAAPCAVDLDGDGDYDLLIGAAKGMCYAYENTGTASSPMWTAKSAWNTPTDIGDEAAPCLADLDGDGDYDLVIGRKTVSLVGYQNTAVSSKPDLTPTSLTPTTLNVDSLNTIAATVNNTGNVDIGAFVATLSVDGVVVDTQSVTGPSAGGSSMVNFTYTPTTIGTYNFTVTADSTNGITESDETNNLLTLPVTVIADTEPPTVSATPAGGNFNIGDAVTLSATDNTDLNPIIYYTTDGTDPTTASTLYTGPITIRENTTLKFIGVDSKGNISPVQTETYTAVDIGAPVATADYGSGGYSAYYDRTVPAFSVTLSATDNVDPNPTIYYTTDGSDPTTSSTPYSEPVPIMPYATTTLKFIAVDASGNISPVQNRTYTTYNGDEYLGGRFNDGNDLVNNAVYVEGNVGVRVLIYGSYKWLDHSNTATYTASELNIPVGATIVSARLYQACTWYGSLPNYTVQFNGHETQQPLAMYYDYIAGQNVFDVTPYFNAAGDNVAIMGGSGGACYGTVLVVIYEAASEPYRQIWINEGADCLISAGDINSPFVGWTTFDNVTTNSLASARAITVLLSGDPTTHDADYMYFNNQTVYKAGDGGTDPSFFYYDVTSVLQDGTNELGHPGYSYFNFAIGVLEVTIKAPVAEFTADTVGGFAPVTVQFTDQSTDATGWSWDFDNNGTIDSTDQNPIWTFAAGTYTVKLTATGPGGVDDEVKTGLITVDPSMIITNDRTTLVYTNIQDAIDDALTQNGDILTVHNGTYTENIYISKQLTLNTTGVVTINAANPDIPIFTISSAGNGTSITGFNLTGTTNAPAIRLYSVDNCQLTGNVITGSNVGIQLYDSDNNTITGNTIQNNQDTGIYINQSTGNTISGNSIISNGVIGILLREANNNNFTGNTVTGNGWAGIALDNANGNTINGANNINSNLEGIHLTGSNNNLIDGNSITGNTNIGISIINSSTGNTITNTVLSQNSVMGVYLRDSNTNNLTSNNIQNNGWIGVCLDNATGNTINSANDISGNLEGLYLVNNSNNTTIQENSIHDNQDTGIYINQSTNNTITSNTTTSNGVVGILLREANDNTINGNTVTGNGWVGIALDNAAGNNINGANTISNSTIGVYINNNSTRNIINGNTIQNNNWAGLVLETAHNTMVYQNNFINNPLQALAINGTGNQFNRRTIGNHWSNWTTHDPRPIEGNETTYDLFPNTTHH